jgi:hypothetical protein
MQLLLAGSAKNIARCNLLHHADRQDFCHKCMMACHRGIECMMHESMRAAFAPTKATQTVSPCSITHCTMHHAACGIAQLSIEVSQTKQQSSGIPFILCALSFMCALCTRVLRALQHGTRGAVCAVRCNRAPRVRCVLCFQQAPNQEQQS